MPAQIHLQPSRVPAWHVLASGPSSKAWIERLAAKKNLVTTNGMCLVVPRVPYWYMGDTIPKDSPIRKWLMEDTGTKRYCSIFNVESGMPCTPLHISGTAFDDPDNPANTAHKYFQFGSSAHVACGIAFKHGARRILVWGLDYQDHSTFHPDDGCTRIKWDMSSVEEGWTRLRHGLSDLGATVWNCNPASRLRALEHADPEQAIKE